MTASPKPSAANALTHGFTAAKFVSDEIAERAEALRRELTQIHEPQTHGEVDCLAELALERARQYELELALSRLVRTEKDRAAELYDRRAQALFEEDFTRWTADPARFTRIFTSTYLGADYVAQLWSGVAADLAPEGPGLTADQARQAAASLGSCWQVSKARDDGAWLMARILLVSPDTDAALAQWVADSATPDDTLARARWHLRQAPDRDTSWQELASRAAFEKNRWSLHANVLRSRYETERALAAETAIGLGTGDKDLEKRLRLTQRYLTTARNRTDRLERRLDGLKKGRLMAAYRAERDADRLSRNSEITYEPIAKRLEVDHAAGDLKSRIPAHAISIHDLPIRDEALFAQSVSNPDDGAMLRNESGPDSRNPPEALPVSSDDASTSQKRAFEAIDPADLKKQMARIRAVDWRDSRAVKPVDIAFLTELSTMRPSLERDTLIRLAFGSERQFRKAWRKVTNWATSGEPRGVSPGVR